ncbi:AAA family ATPase [Rhizobium sp. TRM96647]|uniref:ATP-binding protein n=1 Tax=unclassified Rhizobium TaxID=2613769 RepID=UPI0021E94366|nr:MULTISPECIES: AAA family ATPase [unclassified Rhizobium]MCV3738829.1 AAA family ATPase [Rhizobium sp. TRM96647]MCV3760464.1 AAA family ATPase [Rhizobium sp. TRM96650]
MSKAGRQIHTGALSGERRQVTALFYDIVGSTALLHQLDPEDFGDMQRTLHNEAAAVIRNNSGYLEWIQGDGGCAFFGFPQPSEDAAECALVSALEIVERCEQQFGSSLKVRVGVATGVVVLADASNPTLPQHTEVIGIAPALAARIQSEAAPNGIAVSEATYRLTTGTFEFEEIGHRQIKGFDEPVALWRPIARRQPPDRFTASRRVSTPLVGRDEEIGLCQRRWTRAIGGNGQFVFLHGNAGIGKSRLITEFRRGLERQGVDTVVFQCQPRGRTKPLHPFLELIRQLVAEASRQAEPDRDAIVRYLRSLSCEVGELDAGIVAFLMLGKAQESSDETWSIDLSDEEIRARAVEAMLAVLTSTAVSKPLLIVIEDLHWADTLTSALVARLPEWIAARPVLTLATSRDAIEQHLLDDPNVLAMPLSGLTAEATSELIEGIWETPPPEGLAAFVYEKSDGVPLFAEQLALLLRERAKDGAQDRAGWEAPLRDGVINLRDLISTRLADLGPLRRVAQIASVIGREFRRKLLVAVMEPEQLPISLDEALEKLVHAGILRRKAAGANDRFCHVLIQEAAYDSLLKSERRQIHGRIARLVQAGSVSPLPDETMAWHFELAGQPLEAARYGIQAAEACGFRSAMYEAEHLLDAAERQLAQAGKGDDADDLMLRLLAIRGPVAAALFGRGGEQARSIYERGVSLCAEHKDQDRAKWFPLYWGWWFTAPDYETQRARSDILVRDLEGSADPEVRLQSLHCAWATNEDAGRHLHCLKCVEDGLRLYDESRARFSRGRYGGHDARVCGLGERAFSLWFIGDDAGSSKSINAAKQWAEHVNHLNSLLHALEFDIELKRYRDDHAGVISAANRIAELAEAVPGVLAKAALFRAWARGLSKDAEAGLAEFEAGLKRQREIATYEGAPVYEGMRAELFERTGRNDEALSILDGAIDASIGSGQVFWLAELLRQRALLRHARQEPEKAIALDLGRALQVATEQHASALVTRARLDLKRLGIKATAPDA